MAHALVKLEVSQKQAYIFSSNKLKDNVLNSAVIAWIMSPDYFADIVKADGREELFSETENLVYSGGGHIVLDYEEKETAVSFVRLITSQIHKEYSGIEIFVKVLEYSDGDRKNAKSMIKKMKELSQALEKKKSERLSAFHQGTFGIEKIDSTTLKPTLKSVNGKKYEGQKMPKTEEEIEDALSPLGYNLVNKFEDLGGSHGESSFIAVVHIDGNAMGKKVNDFYKSVDNKAKWSKFKNKLNDFSESIDKDFKDAYKEMVQTVQEELEAGRLESLELKDNNFPVRRIITAGDDICFVTDGRIGIECVVTFIEKLTKKKNKCIKGNNAEYAACAGVAIVHQKYPFYQAYDLAEKLCSNAKKFGAALGSEKETDDSYNGANVSSIDWHIEYGEIKDTLKEIRNQYITADGNHLEMRPYIINAGSDVNKKEKVRTYDNFKSQIGELQKQDFDYARGKLKELRSVLKQGETATQSYIQFNNLSKDFGTFQAGFDGIKRSQIFDALEIADTYISLEDPKEQGENV